MSIIDVVEKARGKQLILWDFDGTIITFDVDWETLLSKDPDIIDEVLMVSNYKVNREVVNFITRRPEIDHVIVSNNSLGPIVKVLAETGIARHFLKLVANAKKPSVRATIELFGQINCHKKDILLVGDRDEIDGEMAHRMGVDYASIL